MERCDRLDKCSFYNEKMKHLPALAEGFKVRYCFNKNPNCARYKVLNQCGEENIPFDLFPNEFERASRIIDDVNNNEIVLSEDEFSDVFLESSNVDLKKLLIRENIAKKICAELNNFVELKDVLITIIEHIRNFTNMDAIGIRLHDGMDYPYYVYDGFSESFIKRENSLCAYDNGNRLKSSDGKKYLLECMCGNIIRGRFDKNLPFFTSHGSFWSNCTSDLLKESTEDDRQGKTRNTCIEMGYESVALVPIRIRNRIIGLIQLNDKKKDMFTLDLIEFMEMIGRQIGLAVNNSQMYTELKKTLNEVSMLRLILPMCSKCKKIRDDKGYWEAVEDYFKDHSLLEFTHGLCPECSNSIKTKWEENRE